MGIKNIFSFWEGARPVPFLLALLVGGIIWVTPTPSGMPPQAWQLFAIFVGTIVAIMVKALPMGAVALLSLAVVIGTNTLGPTEAFSGFSSPVSWLIVLAFLIARGFIKTGLGTRIAYLFIALLGRRSLGLGYGIMLSNLFLAPAIPSNTARSGGVIYPIIRALANGYGSNPKQGTERKIGSFLIKLGYQSDRTISAMFLTAMAANPLMVKLAQDLGVTITWGTWALAALVPGVIGLIFTPLIIYWIYPPEVRVTPDAPRIAREKLKEMGPISIHQWIMLGVFFLLLTLWILGEGIVGVDTTTAALIGVAILLFSGVLTWQDIKKEEGAWDVLIWFSILITLATNLNKLGFIPWFSQMVQQNIEGVHWGTAFVVLMLLYFYVHYFFASDTAQVTAMYAAFLALGIALGVPPLMMALALAFTSNFYACSTHYGTAPAPIFFGSGYVDVVTWWKIGAIMGVFNLVNWLGIGSLWWKFLGIW